MPWIKKNGLYLPDGVSYAQSVNKFSDGVFNELYISLGLYTAKVDGSTSFYAWNAVWKHNDALGTRTYRLHCQVYGTAYVGQENRRHFYADGRPAGGYVYGHAHQSGSWVNVELLGYYNSASGNYIWAIITHGLLIEGAAGTDGTIVDDLGYLRITEVPAPLQPVITHLIIDNKLPPWVDDMTAPRYDKLNRSWFSVDGSSPFGVDLHWAMEEGLIDPTQFLHFYTFEELDENGCVPDYGADPQPLQLFGNAQIIEAYEVVPYPRPTLQVPPRSEITAYVGGYNLNAKLVK